MNLLPDNFPVETLPKVEEHKIEWFYRRFVEDFNKEYGSGHFILAAYAAVPVFLTPDLLFKIWQNFNSYKLAGEQKIIHRIAVPDILLSPLCREVGFELYEMNNELRLALLEWLADESASDRGKARGIRTIEEIALFLEKYHASPTKSGTRWGRAYADSQEFEALSFLEPAKAAKRIFSKLQDSATDTERLRIMTSFVRMQERLKRLAFTSQPNLQSFNNQAQFMNAWMSLIQKNKDGFLQQLRSNPQLMKLLDQTTGGLPVEIDEELVDEVDQIAGRRVRAIVVASTEQDSANARDIKNAIESKILPAYIELTLLVNPSRNEMDQVLTGYATDGRATDDLIFYLSANRVEQVASSSRIYLRNRDSVTDMEIRDKLLAITWNSYTCILDMVGQATAANWIDEGYDRNILFSFDRTFLPPSEGSYFSYFTFALSGAIREFGIEQTNRSLFLKMIGSYVRGITGNVETGRIFPLPEISAPPVMLNRFFAQGKNDVVELQHLLRISNYYQGPVTGYWDAATAEALDLMKRKTNRLDGKTKRYFINALTADHQAFVDREKTALLLIFSDPGDKHPELKAERDSIVQLLRQSSNTLDFEVILLDNPTRPDIERTMKEGRNRDRIGLIYYAGSDKEGNFSLKDGAYPFEEFTALLDYQQNVYIFVGNTSRSAKMASVLVQLGVQYAIGSGGVIHDDVAKDFGVSLFRRLVARQSPAADDRLQMTPVSEAYTQSGHANTILLFRAVMAPPEMSWPQSWFKWRKYVKPVNGRTFAVVIGVGKVQQGQGDELEHCIDNARRFQSLLQFYSQFSQKEVIEGSAIGDHITRDAARKALEPLVDVAEGDCCIIYFSGAGTLQESARSRFGLSDLIFSDDFPIPNFDRQVPFLTEVQELASRRKLHVCLILDIRLGVPFHSAIPPLQWSGVGSFVAMHSIAPPRTEYSRAPIRLGNEFSETLFSMLDAYGLQLNYQQLYDNLTTLLTAITGYSWPALVVANEEDRYLQVFSSRPPSSFSDSKDDDDQLVTVSVEITSAGTRDRIYQYRITEQNGHYFYKIRLPVNALDTLLDEIMDVGKRDEQLKTFFELLIPPEMAERMKGRRFIHWIVDMNAAVIPWEMLALRFGNGEPVAMTRSLARMSYPLRMNDSKAVLIIAEPQTKGFAPEIPGAVAEGKRVAELFSGLPGYTTKPLINSSSEDILVGLFSSPYKVMHFCGHASFDQSTPSQGGLVIGNNIFLTNSEFKQMSVMPELVFINCSISRIHAASFASKMLAGGAQVVIIAATSIADQPAKVYAETFYESLVAGKRLGEAVSAAAKITYQEFPRSQIWGSYLCYGEQHYRLNATPARQRTISEQVKPLSKAALEKFIREENTRRPVTVDDDTQKDRWGGYAVRNGLELSATVRRVADADYEVRLSLAAVDPQVHLTGAVAFLLDKSFGARNQVRITSARNGIASITIRAFEAFTAAAVTATRTELELDLQHLTNAPEGFTYYIPSDTFKKIVDETLLSTQSVVANDPQKNRWGKDNIAGGKQLKASVTPTRKSGQFEVTLSVIGIDKMPLTGEVAFFLHNTYHSPVRYAPVVNGTASIAIEAYEAFTVGAMTDDSTLLELDLQLQDGYPKGFYYRTKGQKRKSDTSVRPESGEMGSRKTVPAKKVGKKAAKRSSPPRKK